MKRIALVWISLGAWATLAAQAPRRALTPNDWDHWRSIGGAALSSDGAWALYSVVPQVGDGEMVVRSTTGKTEYHVPRGFIGRPQMIAAARPDTAAIPPARFSADGHFVLALTYAPMSEYDRARREKRRPADQPKASLAIVDLSTGRVTAVARVKSFSVPADRGDWVAYLLESTDTASINRSARDSARAGAPERTAASPGGAPRPVTDSASHGPRKEFGSALVLRNLVSGAEQRIDDVSSFTFDDSAKWLGYTVSSRAGARDGAYVVAPADGKEIVLLNGPGDYKELAFDRSGRQAAFVSNRDEYGTSKPRYALYQTDLATRSTRPVVSPPSLRAGDVVSDNGRVAFTKDGKSVLFGIAPAPLDSVPADSLYDKAVFDLWSWKDPRLQPQQKVETARDRVRSWVSIYHLADHKVVQLADDSLPVVTLSRNGRLAVAATSERYSIERMWEGGDEGNDIYLIDATTGARKLIREKISGSAQLSPDAKYVVFFDRGHWFGYGTATGKTVDLTGSVRGASFEEETWDTPSTPAPWGLAGFTTQDRSVLVYDRYDVWELDPTGDRAPRMVTDSVGRKQHIVFRLVDLQPGRGAGGGAGGEKAIRAIDPAQPQLLNAFDEATKSAGFYQLHIGAGQSPERIVMAPAAFGTPIKAKHASQFLVTRGTFVDFPNLYTGSSLSSLTQISDANPQQTEFKWGSVELVSWTSSDGVPLQGLLYKPDDFDPTKKYPLIAYFYEKLSQGLHQYIPPAGRNVINPTHYVSNGYLVFEPDIHYEVGYPGPSAMKSIVPGVQMLLEKGFVAPNRLGLQGHSWGGYQTAYLITQTHMFHAAMAGAPVANMTSAYGGIRWGSGLARAFQYEKTQSRIGGSIWQYPMRYFENSPLFWADKITTPLLMMANDADDAVPWYQGIEMFVALRRLGKEVYLLDYNGDVHNPTKRANQKDVAMRMQQFFDYHLRGYPEPEWMIHGIPYRMRGRDQLQTTPTQAGGTTPDRDTKRP